MGTPNPPSLIWGAAQSAPPALDQPIRQDATFANSPAALRLYRAYRDSQILGVEKHLLDSLLLGKTATWVLVDALSSVVQKGQWVCSAGTGIGSVTLATAGALAAAGAPVGIALNSSPPGGWLHIAQAGLVGPSVTQLSAGSAHFAVVNPTTGYTQAQSSVSLTDYVVGTVDAAGTLNIQVQISLGGLDGSALQDYGGSGHKLYVAATETKLGVTATTDGGPHLDSFVNQATSSGSSVTAATIGINGFGTSTSGSAICDFALSVLGVDGAFNGNWWRGDLIFTATWSSGTVTLYNAAGSQSSISAQNVRSLGTNGTSYTATATASGSSVIVTVNGTPSGAPAIKWSTIGQLQWVQ